jgi:hypothetical protein
VLTGAAVHRCVHLGYIRHRQHVWYHDEPFDLKKIALLLRQADELGWVRQPTGCGTGLKTLLADAASWTGLSIMDSADVLVQCPEAGVRTHEQDDVQWQR